MNGPMSLLNAWTSENTWRAECPAAAELVEQRVGEADAVAAVAGAAYWSTSARPPASSGVAALVPPTVCHGLVLSELTQSGVAEQNTV